MDLVENLIQNIWTRFVAPVDLPFERMDYHTAMSKYGSDKPDLRFDYEILNLSDNVDKSRVYPGKACFEAMVIPDGRIMFNNRKWESIKWQVLSEFSPHYGQFTTKNLLFIRGDQFSLGKLKYLAPNIDVPPGHPLLSVKPNDLILFNNRLFGYWGSQTPIGRVRSLIGEMMAEKGLIKGHKFVWVHSFPMFILNAEKGEAYWSSSHHPFTAPLKQHSELVYSSPGEAIGQNFDLVLNGIELGGGSIRICDPVAQKRIFEEILKMSPETIESNFSHLLQALSYGCPPHGGIALGLDRLTSIIRKTSSIREVIAFPKLAKKDYFVDSPSRIEIDYN